MVCAKRPKPASTTASFAVRDHLQLRMTLRQPKRHLQIQEIIVGQERDAPRTLQREVRDAQTERSHREHEHHARQVPLARASQGHPAT